MAATSMRAHTHTPLQTINRGNHFMRPLRSSINGKQKSAVELLQESKCLYVKSETVLDHHQQLKSSSPDHLYSSIVKVRGPPVPPKSAQLRRSYNASASSTDQLQAKLRKLLNADSKENLIEDSNIVQEVKRSPQHYRRSNSQKQTQQRSNHQVCPVHHKSLPDLHTGAETSSDSSEPASCEYVLYTNSSPRQSTNDEISVESSTSRSKRLSSQASSRSRSQSGSSRHGVALTSPVKSSVSYGGSATKTEYRRPETLWTMSDEGDCEEGTRLRPILRSKSDVGRRYTKLTPVPQPPPTPADLDTFFEQLGLNSSDFKLMTKTSSQASSPVFFSDTSSVDSLSLCVAQQSAGGSEGATNPVSEVPSIVERNARIIKWLCNCRKAQLTIPSGVS
ncbi:protein FAM110B isoform X2 [Homalodisca vitripennis]|uniref:protein FAM110B isoform X2 n=1 Tax=Homalodisca vitripennis TaxID=197043 RepID=UPI001EEAD115|nr:protein FAM110B isoform X2 [Homalodisca vitripennis]